MRLIVASISMRASALSWFADRRGNLRRSADAATVYYLLFTTRKTPATHSRETDTRPTNRARHLRTRQSDRSPSGAFSNRLSAFDPSTINPLPVGRASVTPPAGFTSGTALRCDQQRAVLTKNGLSSGSAGKEFLGLFVGEVVPKQSEQTLHVGIGIMRTFIAQSEPFRMNLQRDHGAGRTTWRRHRRAAAIALRPVRPPRGLGTVGEVSPGIPALRSPRCIIISVTRGAEFDSVRG